MYLRVRPFQPNEEKVTVIALKEPYFICLEKKKEKVTVTQGYTTISFIFEIGFISSWGETCRIIHTLEAHICTTNAIEKLGAGGKLSGI